MIKYSIQQGKKRLRQKKAREKTQTLQQKRADKKYIKPKLQEVVNSIARLIDYGLPCLATGRVPEKMHGGHVFSVKNNEHIRFNLHNIHRQSLQSNYFEAHDALMREKLAEEYGDEYYENLVRLKRETVLKPTGKELAEAYERALKGRRELRAANKALNSPRSVKERIKLRNEMNAKINLY